MKQSFQKPARARNAIFYLTYNGLYNYTNGIGTQTQLLISGLEGLQDTLTRHYGPIDLHIVCPAPDVRTSGYDHTFFLQQQARLNRLGARVHLIPYKQEPTQDLWEIRSWRTLCQNVAPVLREQTAIYERSLIICVDEPWLQTPIALEMASTSARHIDLMLVLYSTTYVRHWESPDAAELAWEQQGLETSRHDSRVVLADICPSFTAHLKSHFRLQSPRLAQYTSSILVEDPIFALQHEAVVRATLKTYGVPQDADLVLAFGRAAPLKGFDQLICALAPLRDRVHLVLISVPYRDNDDQQQKYDALIQQHRIAATHVKYFTRDLPRALCQWPRTRAVVIPSRHETFSNIPLEVALWAREMGPVTVASSVGGFVDQIEPGITGFLIQSLGQEHITETLRYVLDLSPEVGTSIRRRAYQRVIEKYDFQRNFPATLQQFWENSS